MALSIFAAASSCTHKAIDVCINKLHDPEHEKDILSETKLHKVNPRSHD